jgi:hypothetical protein
VEALSLDLSGRKSSLLPYPNHYPLKRRCLPARNTSHQHYRQFDVGIFSGLDNRARARQPAVQLAGGNQLLRIIHNFFQLAFETMSYFEQGHWTSFATNIVANNLLCLGAILVRAMIARNLKGGAERVEFCRKEAQS